MRRALPIAALLLATPAWGEEGAPPVEEDAAETVTDAEPTVPPAAPVETPIDEGRTLVAVLFLATGTVDSSLADNLTEVLLAAVASAGRYTIVGREQFGAALGFGGEEQTLECAEDPVCLGRIATVVGAEEVVLGLLGQRAGRFLINLTRIDVAEARAVHRIFRVTDEAIGPLIAAVREGAGELMRPPPGAARVTVNVPDATILLDGEPAEIDPDGVLRGLEPGPHELVVEAEGYVEVRRAFEVDRGATVDLAVSLSRREERVEAPPWHTRWWVWTLVGVAVAGAGAATAAILLRPSPQADATGTLGTVRFPLRGER